MSLIHDERVKLRPQAINTMATSCFAAGGLAPLAADFYNRAADHIPLHTVILGITLFASAPVWLHKLAVAVLDGMNE